MQHQAMNISGAVAYWAAGPSQRELLKARLEQIGLEGHTPNVRTDAAALKSALLEFCDGHKSRSVDLDVQAHKRQSENGFEVLKIKRGERSNEYEPYFSARVHEDNVLFSGDSVAAWPVRELFAKHKGQLTGAAIGQMLIDILAELGGTALRPSGGVYFLPADALPVFERVANVVEETCLDGSGKVYLLRTTMDEGTIRAVRDALTAEVTAATAQIVTDVQENLVTEEAIARRVLLAGALHERVSRYESILGEAMSTLHDAIRIAEQAAANAAAIKESNEVFDGVFAA